MAVYFIRVTAAGLFFFLWWKFAREDFASSKIRNLWIKRSFLAQGALYAWAAANSLQGMLWGGISHNFHFYWAAAVHVSMAFLIAVALWLFKMWPAGDAKLFLVSQALFPLMQPASPLFPYRLSLASLINAFIPAAIFVVAQSAAWNVRSRMFPRLHFYRTLRATGLAAHLQKQLRRDALRKTWANFLTQTVQALRPHFDKWDETAGLAEGLLKTASCLMAAAAIQEIFKKFLPASWALPLLLPAAVYFWRWFIVRGRTAWAATLLAVSWAALVWMRGSLAAAGWFAAKTVFFGISMAAAERAASMVADQENAVFVGAAVFLPLWAVLYFLGLQEWLAWSLWGAVFGLGLLLMRVFRQEGVEWIERRQTAPYMLLGEPTLQALRQDRDFYENYFKTLFADGLTRDQARLLRAWCARHGVERIAVRRAVPFAFWIFLGAALSWALGGDISSLARSLAAR